MYSDSSLPLRISERSATPLPMDEEMFTDATRSRRQKVASRDLESRRTTVASDVGTAWLLLSHAGWLAVSVASISLGLSLLVLFNETSPLRASMKPLAIGWTVLGTLFGVWTIYAVATTWKSNRLVPNAVFGDGGFSLVTILAFFVVVMGIWSLVNVAQL